MFIQDIGGEFSLIQRLKSLLPSYSNKNIIQGIIQGIGDDCAVLEDHLPSHYQLITIDTMVEHVHFNLQWQSFYQIGEKLLISNISDIYAMGGYPQYALVSLSIPQNMDVHHIDELYKGLTKKANEHHIVIIGGDTTHSPTLTLSLVLLGTVQKPYLRLRSMAQLDDLICISGFPSSLPNNPSSFFPLGKSAVALSYLQKGLQAPKKFYQTFVTPKLLNYNDVKIITHYAHAMIDVSDGVGSDLKHICNQSQMGAVIETTSIPIDQELIQCAKDLKFPKPMHQALNWILYGGEDYCLLFTIPKHHLSLLKQAYPYFTVIGHITPQSQGMMLHDHEGLTPLKNGYNHFFK